MVKGAVCKTAMQRFDPARRLQTALGAVVCLVDLVCFVYLVCFVQPKKLDKPNNGSRLARILPVARRSLRAYARLREKSIRHCFVREIWLIGA